MLKIYVSLLFYVGEGRVMRKNELGTSTQQNEQPPDYTLLDNRMNHLLKDNFFDYFDLKLSNSAVKVNEMAHQTQISRNLSLGGIIRFFYDQDS